MKRNSKISRVLHIKNNTEGTSNEISFSVLDAYKRFGQKSSNSSLGKKGSGGLIVLPTALNQGEAHEDKVAVLDGDTGSAGYSITNKVALPPQPLHAKLHGDNLQSFTSSDFQQELQPEVQRRKRKRLMLTIAAWISTLLLIGGIVTGVAWLINDFVGTQAQQKDQFGKQLQALTKIDESTLLVLDELVVAPGFEVDMAQVEALNSTIPRTLRELSNLRVDNEEFILHARDGAEKVAAQDLSKALVSRETIVSKGQEIIKLKAQASNAVHALDQVAQAMVQAHSKIEQATSLVAQTTPENISIAQTQLGDAQVQLLAAQDILNKLTEESNSFNVQAVQDYLAKRLEAISHARASNEAALVQNKSEADAQNALANAAEEAAAQLASALPEHLIDYVRIQFKERTEQLFEDYKQARKDAASADSHLRDYLGTTSK